MSKHAFSRPEGKFLQFLRRALQEICKSGAGLLENHVTGKLRAGGKVALLQPKVLAASGRRSRPAPQHAGGTGPSERRAKAETLQRRRVRK